MGIRAFTAKDVSSFTGHHQGSLMVIVTEAQGVEAGVWEGAFANLTGADSKFLVTGNPLEPSGRFYQVANSDNWQKVQIAASDHPNVIEGEEVIPGAVTRKFIRDMRDTFGEGSSVYQARVQGEFPETGEQGLIRRSWLEHAAQRWERFQQSGEEIEEEPVVSVDVARFGPDSTAVAVRRGNLLEEIETWSKKDLMETTRLVIRVLNRVGVERYVSGRGRGEVIVDAVGLGSGVADRLDEEGYAVSAFKGSRKARDRDRFMNARAESWWALRDRLEAGEIMLPRDPELFDELLAVRWRASAGDKVRIESKDDMRDRIGRSPDRGDAVAMAMYSHARRRVPAVSEVGILQWSG